MSKWVILRGQDSTQLSSVDILDKPHLLHASFPEGVLSYEVFEARCWCEACKVFQAAEWNDTYGMYRCKSVISATACEWVAYNVCPYYYDILPLDLTTDDD